MTVANGSDSITLPPSPCKEREKEKRKAAPKISVQAIALTEFKLSNSVFEANLYTSSFTYPIHCLSTLERCPSVRCLHDEWTDIYEALRDPWTRHYLIIKYSSHY